MAPSGPYDSHFSRSSSRCVRDNPEASLIRGTERQTCCQWVQQTSCLSLLSSSQQTDILDPSMRDSGKKEVFWRNASAADLFLSMWTDRVPVRTSSYLKGMHWRDLRGEKVTQVTSEAKCLDCVRAPLAMRRSSTLPCLSSSQLHWMRPAGTAPLSDNCNSSLYPCTPPTLTYRSAPAGLQACLITHIIQCCVVAGEQSAHFTTSGTSVLYSTHASS